MKGICQHCEELIVGNAYRVTSEDEDVSLLNMVVCSICAMEAKRLRLYTEEIDFRTTHTFRLKTKRVKVRFGSSSSHPVLKKPYR